MSIKIELCALILVVACATSTSAFFLSWGSPQPVKTQQPPPPQHTQLPQYPTLAYYQRVMQQQQPQPQYVDSNGIPVQSLQPIPAIPIQVPLQAQFAPAPSVQNVQLVPCLCPVSQDMEYVGMQNVESTFPASQAQPTQSNINQYQQQQQQQQIQQIQQQLQQQKKNA